jgi:gas vesicle protein
MRTSRLLLLAAVGGAVALLLTTDKGKKITKKLADDAGGLKDQLTDYATGTLASLKKMLSKEIDGLTDDARSQISGLLDEGTQAGKKAKRTVGSL